MSLPATETRALGSTLVVLTTSTTAHHAAFDAAIEQIDAIDLACSRFRDDSELCRLNQQAGTPVEVSPLLLEAIGTARRAARQTGGLLDPTVGAALVALGYDRDFRSVIPDGPVLRGVLPRSSRWREIEVDPRRSTVTAPAGVALDLGATAKALAADRAARAAAYQTGTGVLVGIGGDISTAGPAPADGWPVLVSDDHERTVDPDGETVSISSGGLATSGTAVRHWRRGADELHHLVDPRTARPAHTCWRTVSVAAASCVDANVASTASMVMGEDAMGWLARQNLPARLVRHDGRIERIGGWPEPQPATSTVERTR